MMIYHGVIWENPDRIHLTIRCRGHTINSHRTPMLAMCRWLKDQGADDDDVLATQWSDGRPSMRMKVGWGASMTVSESDKRGLRREPYREVPRSVRGGAQDSEGR